MSNVYSVEVSGKEVTYGAYKTFSRQTDEEWSALCHAMVIDNYPDFYEKNKHNEEVIIMAGELVSMSERYEALLELLPQCSYSKAGTNPTWVASEVSDNTFDKGITQDDVSDAIESNDTYESLSKELISYFGISKESG